MGAQRLLFRAPVYLYRWRCGRLLGRRFLLLIHTGRRTGRRRETVLEVVEYREAGPELVVVSAFGRNADWLRNIAATPGPEVVIGRERFVAAHRLLDPEEAMGVIERYEQRNRLVAPIVRRVLSRLLGWPYRGSASDRRRLVDELPFVAFRPRR
ncbi:MAG TPA: nitroreductase family deazaflavin-dependent oxidoreductase [Stellaceae bacterium]|nr:nitroreductase family deazaflavin-dependent oxidoreductase [Stellaceae bacterium]